MISRNVLAVKDGISSTPISRNGRPDLAQCGLAFRLLQALVEQLPGQNVVISPASIAILLHILHDGADGDTRFELADCLQISRWREEDIADSIRVLMSPSKMSGAVELVTPTALWLGEEFSIQPQFAALVATRYRAEILSLGSDATEAVHRINAWVAAATHERIASVMHELAPLARFIAVNAVYFKDAWSKPFEPGNTREQAFLLSDGGRTYVSFMRQFESFAYLDGGDLQMVRLEYDGHRYAMDVLLPKTTPREFLSRVHGADWEHLTKQLDYRLGHIELPRLRLEFSCSLRAVLEQLGVRQAFDARLADFSAIAREPLQLGEVLQKTFVDVDEKGTEAAAVTAMPLVTATINPGPSRQPFRMVVDRPFLFSIHEVATGAIIFLGVVENPGDSPD